MTPQATAPSDPSDPSAASRAQGALIGQCLGDALGFPVEGHPPEICQRYVDDLLRSGRAHHACRPGFAMGQYTDDSQLARELLQSVVRRGAFAPQDYAQAIADIFSSGRIVGRGRATQEAATRLHRGVPWDQAGTPAPSAGNGSAMRAGPVGILFWADPPRLAQVATDQGRITHRDPRCAAGALVIAGAVAHRMRGHALDADAFIQDLAALAAPHDPVMAAALGQMPGWLQRSPEQAAPLIARVGLAKGYSDGWRGISPFVTPSVLWAVYAFLKSPDRYWDTVCTAIAVGGDVDTTAAMAGAISGAHVGLQGLPQDLARRVHDRGTWGTEALIQLVRDATQITAGRTR